MTDSKKQLSFGVAILLVLILISQGCSAFKSSPDQKEIYPAIWKEISPPIQPGMNYNQAKDILVQAGLEEEKSAIWSIMPPENISIITYFLGDNKYLLVSISELTGKIENLSILEPSPLGKKYDKSYELKSFPEE